MSWAARTAPGRVTALGGAAVVLASLATRRAPVVAVAFAALALVPTVVGLVAVRAGARPRWTRTVPAWLLLLAGGAVLAAAAIVAVPAVALAVGLRALRWMFRRSIGLPTGGRAATAPAVGSVWTVRIPNDDPHAAEPHKWRPAVVVATAGEDGAVVVWSTSQTKHLGKPDYLDVTDLRGWPADRRGKRSILNLRNPYVATADECTAFRADLPPATFEKIRAAYEGR